MQPRDRDDIVDNSPMTGESYTGRSATQEGGATQQARERAEDAGQKVKERAEEGRDRAAGGMQSAAEKLREQSEGQGGMRGQVGTKAADTMERGASYLREHDTQEIVDDVEKYVREHPMQALAGAVVGGFIIGRILR